MPDILPYCGFAWDPAWAPRLHALNPFWGCPFDCSYCWSKVMAHRFHREPPGGWGDVQVNPIFENISLTALEFDAQALPTSTILIGATCDPYPPLERTTQLTQAILDTLRSDNRDGMPPHKILVLTKSPIVCRDWELLKEMEAWVGFSITAPAGVDTRPWEPHAPSNASRIAALKFLHGKGVKTFLSCEPWLVGTKVYADPEAPEGISSYDYDVTRPWRIIEETSPWVDYYIVGPWNLAGRPKRELVPYYRTALPGVIEALEATGKPFWVKPELRKLLNG